MARNKNKIRLKPVLFIACEGTSSEFQYFESWSQTDGAREIFENINVYPDENEDRPKTTPYQLFLKAKNVLEDKSADFAWIVFDHDNHPNLPQTFIEAENLGVKIAFSSRSFEEWVIMHFEKNITAFNATECKRDNKPINCGSASEPFCDPINCLSGYIRRQNFIPSYSKKKEFDLFTLIRNRTEIAIVNAAWVRFQMDAVQHQREVWQLNPYTDVDLLILKLQGREDGLVWGKSGIAISLNGWTVKVSQSGAGIILQISHTLPQAQILNTIFEQSSFFTTDDELHHTECRVNSKEIIQNDNGSTNGILRQGDVVEYTLHTASQPYFLFSNNLTNTKIFVYL